MLVFFNMRKIFLILASFFLLASCGASDSPVANIDTTEFSATGFSIFTPTAWTSTGSFNNLANVGNGNIVLASISPEKKYNFSDNIVVIVDDLEYVTSSRKYSEQNNAQTQKKYAEYKLVSAGGIIFGDSDESKYYVFDAKYNNNTQKLRFVQTAKVCGTRVYLLHASIALNANYEDYVNIFRTFSCK